MKTLLILLLLASPLYAQPFDYSSPPLNVAEEDGSPSTFPYKLKFPNTSLTDNGDSTTSVDFATPLGSTFLKLDQTTPQTISNGNPIFGAGLTISTGQDLTFGTTQWNSGDSIDADAIVDGSTNAIPTLTQESNWDNHISDNTQAHSDYLLNNESDSSSGTITAAGFTTTGIVSAEQITSTDDANIADLLTVGDGLKVSGAIAATGTTLEIHTPSYDYWIALFYNDTYSPTTPMFGYYGYNTGKFAIGTEVAQPFALYTGSYNTERMQIESDGKLSLFAEDMNDYIQITTPANIPTISTVGTCDLKIDPDGGDVDFVDNNITTTGNIASTNVSVSTNGKFNLEGSAGDTYFTFDGTNVYLYVNGVLSHQWGSE